ncbi:MAG TPA: IclR family transcriptional regulator [Ktedonosporobacter sp.]|nr:IclR family transcriptional regulator [Ktedonosporobacter sp.]
MVERSVQNTELDGELTENVPAPMVARAFQLLDLLMVSEEGLALSHLARELHMSKGSMHRLLKTLENCGVVGLHEDRLYVLGPRIYKLATYVRGHGLRRLALPAMQRLVASIGETIFLGRVEQESLHVIESVEAGGEHLFPHVSVPRGTHLPLVVGTGGRLLLASWPVERRQAWLQKHPLPRFTEYSITDPAQYLKAVEETARTGLAIDHEEYLSGVNAVSVPITGPEKLLVGLLCALGFASHFDDDAMRCAAEQLKEEAEAISRSLGATTPNLPSLADA